MNTFHSPAPFHLESGETLPEIDIAYHTFGTLNERKDNVVWVSFHKVWQEADDDEFKCHS